MKSTSYQSYIGSFQAKTGAEISACGHTYPSLSLIKRYQALFRGKTRPEIAPDGFHLTCLTVYALENRCKYVINRAADKLGNSLVFNEHFSTATATIWLVSLCL